MAAGPGVLPPFVGAAPRGRTSSNEVPSAGAPVTVRVPFIACAKRLPMARPSANAFARVARQCGSDEGLVVGVGEDGDHRAR